MNTQTNTLGDGAPGFESRHMAMILKYSGISFVSAAVNHGFFSGTRSFATALLGVVLFVAGAWMEHSQQKRGEQEQGQLEQSLLKTLLIGAVLSIGLGFFTGGLAHFPDSPGRSSWVVPLGYFLSFIALMWTLESSFTSKIWRYGLLSSLVVAAVSAGAYQVLQRYPAMLSELAHAHGPSGHAKPSNPAEHNHAAQTNSSGATVATTMGSTAAFEAANTKMHQGMAIQFTGDADVDFLAGMIPHHKGAVEMAQIVLQHGKDKQVKALAQEIIEAQKREIALMQTWVKALDHSKHAH